MESVKKISDKRNNPKGDFIFYVSTSGHHGGCMFALKCQCMIHYCRFYLPLTLL